MDEQTPAVKRPTRAAPQPLDHDGFIRQLSSALESEAVKTAITLLFKAKPEWARSTEPKADEPSRAGVGEILELVLRADIGPAIIAGCSPKVRRVGRDVSSIARQVWRAAYDDYVLQLQYVAAHVKPRKSGPTSPRAAA